MIGSSSLNAWLIPACAGKTNGFVHLGAGEGAHPRVCGENCGCAPSIGALVGSSPRVRGKQPATPHKNPATGLIPACAGKTRSSRSRSRAGPAHPRVCGENALSRIFIKDANGSSPRVRGKQRRSGRGPASERLIPACAGKTSSSLHTSNESWAHPRVCGENTCTPFPWCRRGGSSPRVRGKPRLILPWLTTQGLIPACAGKTDPRLAHFRHRRAHPRVCGENFDSCGIDWVIAGSSPRVRGKQRTEEMDPVERRLIPACAGKTLRSYSICDAG